MKGKCPHCLHDVLFLEAEVHRGAASYSRANIDYSAISPEERVGIHYFECPNCSHLVVLSMVQRKSATKPDIRHVWPYSPLRLVPSEVPENLKTDYLEAVEVLPISAKASAALSRRCLQTVLTEAGGAKAKELSRQIDEVLPRLPSHLAEIVDAVRAVGNFAAHPIKSQSSGQVVEVEPGEAECNLDVLDGLFDFYYVQPAKTKQRRAALDQKLKEVGKPPLKKV
jgi:hypothetical protein